MRTVYHVPGFVLLLLKNLSLQQKIQKIEWELFLHDVDISVAEHCWRDETLSFQKEVYHHEIPTMLNNTYLAEMQISNKPEQSQNQVTS